MLKINPFGNSWPFARTILLVLTWYVIAGCSAGSGEGLGVGGRPLSEGGNVPLAPTLASIQANVFDAACVVCHSGATAPLGLRLDNANSFSNLVGVPSQQSGSTLRVNPGLPDQSYLIQKLEGTAASGAQMPLGGPPIPPSTITFVRQWISDGALPDPGPAPSTPPVVIAMTPDPGAILATLPPQISVALDQEPDASTINIMTVELLRSVDAQFDNGDDVVVSPASVQISTANSRLLLIDLNGVTPVEDRYRLSLRGRGANLILSLGGIALDGDFAGALPSGDGLAGGDFVAEFSVQGVQPTLASIQDRVFAPTCAPGCHTGPPGPGLPAGMDLSSAAASFASLVGVASTEQPATLRVAPSDADASYLVHKIEGTAAVGARMPFGGPPLPQETIDAIRLWIDLGANP